MGEWLDIKTAPQDGTPVIAPEFYRFLPYKPQGQKQMGKKGRWQRHNGYGWDNCEEPPCWKPAEEVKKKAEFAGIL